MVKMNGTYTPQPAAPLAFADRQSDRQSRDDSKECCRPALLSERGVSMTENEAYKMHIQLALQRLRRLMEGKDHE